MDTASIGWHPDPWHPGQQRWYDGVKFTEEVRTPTGGIRTAPKQFAPADPGWYPDPWRVGRARRWDGQQWTDATQGETEGTGSGPDMGSPPGWYRYPDSGGEERTHWWDGFQEPYNYDTVPAGTDDQEFSRGQPYSPPVSATYVISTPKPGTRGDQEEKAQGCAMSLGIPVAIAVVLVALAAALIGPLDDTSKQDASAVIPCTQHSMGRNEIQFISCDTSSSTDDSTSTDSSSSAVESKSSEPTGFDGHWVLVDGLQDTYIDMGLSCSHSCDQPGRQLTIDQSSATIDISGTKVTGGTYKTGYSSTLPGNCDLQESRVDATASGGVDPSLNYGQLIVDGTEVRATGCDSNLEPIVTNLSFHTSRFFFLKGDTLVLCFNIDPSTVVDACTNTGDSAIPPDKLGDGTLATFKRG